METKTQQKEATEKFKFTGYGFPIKAKVAADCLLSIYKKNDSQLTPEAVLSAAKNKTSPLHGCFEWNDKIAGNEHRLDQARHLIRGVKIIRVIDEKETEVNCFVNIKKDSEGALTHGYFGKATQSYYITVNDAMGNDATRQYTVDVALIELERWMEKYKSLNELSKMYELINYEKNKLKKS
jgi:hypothetical protein